MVDAVAQSLPIAVGLLLASMPVVVVVLVLVTSNTARVVRAFLAGWALGLLTTGAVVVLLADVVQLAGGSPRWASYLKIVLGITLVVLAARKWFGRPRPGDAPKVPAWMAALDTMTAGRAFGLAFLLGSVNPKNLVLVASGATVIAHATSVPREQLGALVVFVLVGSLGVAAPAVVRRVLGSRSGPVLDAANAWMTRNGAVIMAGVLLALGAVMIGNGIGGL